VLGIGQRAEDAELGQLLHQRSRVAAARVVLLRDWDDVLLNRLADRQHELPLLLV
jgi:hypothetical protein